MLFLSSSCAYLPSRHRRDVAMGASACTCADSDSKCRCEEDHPEGVAELGPLDDFDLSQMPTCETASSMLVIPISDVTQELALQDKTESWPHAFVLKPVNMPELRRPQPGGTPRTNSSELSSTKEYVIDVVRPFSGETERSSTSMDARVDDDNQGSVGSVTSPAHAKSNEEGAKDSAEQLFSSAPEMQTLHHISAYLSESDEDDTVKRSPSFNQKTLPDKAGPTTSGPKAPCTQRTNRQCQANGLVLWCVIGAEVNWRVQVSVLDSEIVDACAALPAWNDVADDSCIIWQQALAVHQAEMSLDRKLALELAEKQMLIKEAEEEAAKEREIEEAAKAAAALAHKQKLQAATTGANPFSTGGGRVYQPGVFVCDERSGHKPQGAVSFMPSAQDILEV
ncbi:hypothetical protein AK812_SmicGene36781 [Symbiodinium microadriaticum]|uniref:Uncharacterized protein n=1 Tax=Symbiodinium microadriaticum TaxID=2951 RepID=A0A1Q9CI09_SYMMI|nr:hypothetical protein AK812_SmicGene36781 [Symbiodinium microadriaticum]